MTIDEKIKLCTEKARQVSARYSYLLKDNVLTFDDLVDIGFAGITTNDKDQAGAQAYLHMKHVVTEPLRKKPLIDRRVRAGTTERTIEDLEMVLDLADRCRKLGKQDKEILKLRFWDDLSYKDIAYKLGHRHANWAQRKLVALLQKLKDWLV